MPPVSATVTTYCNSVDVPRWTWRLIMMTKNTVQENRVRLVNFNYGMYMSEWRRTRALIPINISTVIDGGTATTCASAGSGKEEAVEEAAANRRVVVADGRMFRTGEHG